MSQFKLKEWCLLGLSKLFPLDFHCDITLWIKNGMEHTTRIRNTINNIPPNNNSSLSNLTQNKLMSLLGLRWEQMKGKEIKVLIIWRLWGSLCGLHSLFCRVVLSWLLLNILRCELSFDIHSLERVKKEERGRERGKEEERENSRNRRGRENTTSLFVEDESVLFRFCTDIHTCIIIASVLWSC